uniref:Pre-mRNA-splicing factor SYF1 central HAT repeats domain-containing protein n=1 Tax=Trichogramma kaykai TaxID=54128 RepID=A0ABD2XQ89_9HYME
MTFLSNKNKHNLKISVVLKKKITELQYEIDGDDIDSDSNSARLNYHLIESNSASLRNNPHDVFDWLKRVELFEGQPESIINNFSEAVQTVDPEKAVGELPKLMGGFCEIL